jgi:hypothetical protein
LEVAQAGAALLAFRTIGHLSYAFLGGKSVGKKIGGLFHLPEIYLLYVAGSIAKSMISA